MFALAKRPDLQLENLTLRAHTGALVTHDHPTPTLREGAHSGSLQPHRKTEIDGSSALPRAESAHRYFRDQTPSCLKSLRPVCHHRRTLRIVPALPPVSESWP